MNIPDPDITYVFDWRIPGGIDIPCHTERARITEIQVSVGDPNSDDPYISSSFYGKRLGLKGIDKRSETSLRHVLYENRQPWEQDALRRAKWLDGRR